MKAGLERLPYLYKRSQPPQVINVIKVVYVFVFEIIVKIKRATQRVECVMQIGSCPFSLSLHEVSYLTSPFRIQLQIYTASEKKDQA